MGASSFSRFFAKRVGDLAMLLAMEPTLTTDPELKNILAELSSLEPIFHWPKSGTTRAALEKMTVDDFWETGASGRRYSQAICAGCIGAAP